MNEKLKEKSESALAAAIEANLVEQVKFFASSSLVKFYDDEKMIRMVTGFPVSTLNLIAGARLSDDDIDQQVETALEPFMKQRVPAIWWVGPTTIPENLGSYLEKYGLEKIFNMPGMYCELDLLEIKSVRIPPGFTYNQVNNDDLLRIWAETETIGFEADPAGTDYIYEFEKTLGTDPDSPWVRYVGFIDGKPVGVSILFQAAGVAAVFNVAVVPEFRRQGIGTLMTEIPLLKARSLGYKYGMLKASPTGIKLYQSMNFKVCCKIGLYHLGRE